MLKQVLWHNSLLGHCKVVLIHPVLLNLLKSEHNMGSTTINIVTMGLVEKEKACAAAWRKATTRDSKWWRETQEGTGSRAGRTSILSSTMPPLEGKKSWRSRAQGQSWSSSAGVWKDREVLSPLGLKLPCPGHCPFHPSLGPAPCPAVTPLYCTPLPPLSSRGLISLLLRLHSISCNQC